MKRISFEGIGETAATFAADEGVIAGQVVKMTGDGQVGPCGAGEAFCGVALTVREGYAAVQVGGFVKAPCASGGVSAGLVKLTADGNGGVTAAGATGAAAQAEGGETAAGTAVERWVAEVDTAEKTVTLLL